MSVNGLYKSYINKGLIKKQQCIHIYFGAEYKCKQLCIYFGLLIHSGHDRYLCGEIQNHVCGLNFHFNVHLWESLMLLN